MKLKDATFEYFQSFTWVLAESGEATELELREMLNVMKFIDHGLKNIIDEKESMT